MENRAELQAAVASAERLIGDLEGDSERLKRLSLDVHDTDRKLDLLNASIQKRESAALVRAVVRALSSQNQYQPQ
jgi:hypothetical protein